MQFETCRMAEKCFGSVEIPDQVIRHIFLKPESGDKLCVGENGGTKGWCEPWRLREEALAEKD